MASLSDSTMFCRRCGYDICGQSLSRCPECGTTFNPQDESTYRNSPRRMTLWSWCCLISGMYPLLSIAMAYLAAVSAMFTLGHWPRPYIDPIGVNPVAMFFRHAWWLSVNGCMVFPFIMPVLFVLTLALARDRSPSRRRQTLAWTGFAAAAWLLAFFLIYLDIGRVFDWFFD
jgi:hypothetical protein